MHMLTDWGLNIAAVGLTYVVNELKFTACRRMKNRSGKTFISVVYRGCKFVVCAGLNPSSKRRA